ncbi:MAG TPA: hypothetical protein VES01_00390 [Dermatophilaceae bacterium]|nr:hypothetical protein [Dermatophilaceae bacterium]
MRPAADPAEQRPPGPDELPTADPVARDSGVVQIERTSDLDLALEHRGARLVHLAATLSGGLADADALLRSALRRARWQPARLADPDRAQEWVRRLVVTEFLSWRRRVRRPRVRRRPDEPAQVVTADWRRVHGAFRGHRRQWVVLVLRYGQGLDDAAIGHALGCPTGVVTHTAARALARLGRGWSTPEDEVVRRVEAALATSPSPPERHTSRELLSWLRAEHAPPSRGRGVLGWVAALACLAVVATMLWWPRAADTPGSTPGLGTSTASVQPTPASAAARAAVVLTRFRAAVSSAAPPRLLVVGPVWEALEPPAAATTTAMVPAQAAGAQLIRGRLRDEMPPIDDRAAVGTVRMPDGSEAMTPVLGLHETFADLAAAAPPCPRCPPVVAVSGRLVAMTVRTPSGRAVVPGQEFTFRGSSVRVRRLAIPVTSLVEVPPLAGGEQFLPLASGRLMDASPGSRSGPATDRPRAAASTSPAASGRVASGSTPTGSALATPPTQVAPGRVIAVSLAGTASPRVRGCRDTRVSLVEADDAVAVAVSPAIRTGPGGSGPACDPRGRTVTLTLAAPLGTRVVLDVATSRPVPVPFVTGP